MFFYVCFILHRNGNYNGVDSRSDESGVSKDGDGIVNNLDMAWVMMSGDDNGDGRSNEGGDSKRGDGRDDGEQTA